MFKRLFILFSLIIVALPISTSATPLETFLQDPFDSVPHGKIEDSFSFKDGIVYIEGKVNVVLLENFTNLDASKIHTIIFNSVGGLTRVASNIAKIIHENDIETEIPAVGRCYSACALMFQAGSVRTVHETSYLMYHVVTVPNPEEEGKRIPTFNGTMVFFLELIKYGLPEEIAYQITPGANIFVSAPAALVKGIATVMVLDAPSEID